MPRRGGNSLLQAIEELRVPPRAHQSVGRPMAGFFDFLVDRRFPELPSEQPHSSGEAAIIRGARKSQRVITATGHQARADRQPGRHLVGF